MENPFEIIIEKLNRIENLLTVYEGKENNIEEKIPISPEILNTEQAAAFNSISMSTLYKYTSTRQIPHFKRGKRIFFKKAELIEWMTKNKIATMEEIEQEAINYIIRNMDKFIKLIIKQL